MTPTAGSKPLRQATLLDALQELSAAHDLASVTSVVGRAVRALVGADGATFVLREGDLVYYVDEDAIGPLWKGRRFPVTACISGWVMLNQQAAVVPDISLDPRIPLDAYLPTFVRSLACVPIRAKDPIGAIGAYWARCYEATARDVALLQALANASAVALANVELFDTLARECAAREQAEATSRAWEEFMAMLGHELRNPLAPIVTALQVVAERGGAADREHAIIDRQLRHVVRLVDDLLDVSRVTRDRVALHKERVSVASIVERAVEEASPLLDARRHHLELRVAPDLCVDGDRDRLVQVVANLLMNAAKYAPDGGHVRLEAEGDGEGVLLRVVDDGIGIAPDLLPRIFDRFVQGAQGSDRRMGGLGLGLALVHSLVSLHGGSVSARSEGLGRGSEFTVRLPAAPERPSAPAHAPAHPPPARPRSLRVLIVDDNEDAAEMLGALLSTMGWEVAVAGDGPQALRVLDRFEPDVALLDIGLPAMNGYELAGKIRERLGADTPRMIAVTGYGQDTDRRCSAELGFDAHLVKPVDPDVLLRAIEGAGDLRG